MSDREINDAADRPRGRGLQLTWLDGHPAELSIAPREATAYRWQRPGADMPLRTLMVPPSQSVNMLLADAEPPYDIDCRTEAEPEWRLLYEVRPTRSGLIMHSHDDPEKEG